MKKIIIAILSAGFLFAGISIFADNNKGFVFPENALVGYWGVQAPTTGTTTAEAFDHGYNTIMLSFAAVAGDNVNAPVPNTGELNFFKDGCSPEGTKGALTFPSPTEYGQDTDPQLIKNMVESLPAQLADLNEKGAVVLLSIGGAGALLPENLPSPQDFVDAFESINKHFSNGSGKTYIHGIDWDLENSVNGSAVMDWAAKASIILKKNGYIVSCAPQSTNFNPTVNTYVDANWNAYVPLIAAMEAAGTPIDSIMPQWYEPGGSRPADNTVDSIKSFIEMYYNTGWTVERLPVSEFYDGTSFKMGEWLSNNKKKLILGIGAGKGWNGVTNYTPDVLSSVFNEMNGEFGGYMVWDTEIDSGQIAEWSNGYWTIGDGLKDTLSYSNVNATVFI